MKFDEFERKNLFCSRNDGDIKWVVDTETNTAITCMDFYDLTADGNKEIILGFDDGTVQVYAIDSVEYHTDTPRLIFSQSCHESITGVQGAVFGSVGFEEVLVVTYSGN
jgi:Bardet-Biedl syndrome 7 protein